jgi:hypothetical protein
MIENIDVKQDGTVVTTKQQQVGPDPNKKCQAVITTQIVLTEPLTNGKWNVIDVINDNYIIVLDNRGVEDALQELKEKLQGAKEQWTTVSTTIS